MIGCVKKATTARLVKLLNHTRLDRGMTLIAETSRCIRRYEVHELVVTDQRDCAAGGRIGRVGFLGFAEFSCAGVIEFGDELWIGSAMIGTVLGFDACHFPNHYNIIVQTPVLMTGVDLRLGVSDPIVFQPARASAVTAPPSIIAGFGRAGSRLHLPCIRQARAFAYGPDATDQIFVFDPVVDRRQEDCDRLRHTIWVEDLAAIPRVERDGAVIHVCTPPNVRSEVVAAAAKLGMCRFVLEKPMASSAKELDALTELKSRYGLEILVVSNWVTSNLTAMLQQRLRDRPDIAIKRVTMRQVKSRITRSHENDCHKTAFEVEIPHMLGFAFLLCGPVLHLRDATSWDLAVGGAAISNMGGSDLTLESGNGATIVLHADHMSPLRERSLVIELSDGSRYVGYFPCTSADLYSQLLTYEPSGALVEREFIEDDTLTQFFIEAYHWFAGSGARPRSDFDFNTGVCEILLEAKRRSVATHTPFPMIPRSRLL